MYSIGMAERASISVSSDTLIEFNAIRREWNQSQDDMTNVLMRAWRQMPHDEQGKAITGKMTPPAPEPFVAGNPETIQSDSLQLTASMLCLSQLIERSMRDGKLDSKELAQLMSKALKTDKDFRRLIADCQELAKSAAAKSSQAADSAH